MNNYALTHFATEETHVIQFNYPEYEHLRKEFILIALPVAAILTHVRKKH